MHFNASERYNVFIDNVLCNVLSKGLEILEINMLKLQDWDDYANPETADFRGAELH